MRLINPFGLGSFCGGLLGRYPLRNGNTKKKSGGFGIKRGK